MLSTRKVALIPNDDHFCLMSFVVLERLANSSERTVWTANDEFFNFGGIRLFDPDEAGVDSNEAWAGDGHWEENAEMVVCIRACGLVEAGERLADELVESRVLFLASPAAVVCRCTASASCGGSL